MALVAAVVGRGRSVIRVNSAAASDRGYSLRHKLQPAPIHIRRQNRNAHPFAFAHQDRDFFGVIDFVGEQTSHEFDRIVRL